MIVEDLEHLHLTAPTFLIIFFTFKRLSKDNVVLLRAFIAELLEEMFEH